MCYNENIFFKFKEASYILFLERFLWVLLISLIAVFNVSFLFLIR